MVPGIFVTLFGKRRSKLKNYYYVIGALSFLTFVTVFFFCRTRVDFGYAGVRVQYYGSGAGVDPNYVPSGVVFYNPLTELIEEFPTTEKWVQWTMESIPESPNDESITFSDKNGANVNADIAMSLHFEADKTPVLYEKTRRTYQSIVHDYLRILVRGKINRESEKLDIVQIYGEERSKMMDRAKKALNDDLAEIGIVIDTLDFQGKFRVSEQVQNSIDKVIVARQAAIEADQKVKQIQAEAEQAREKAVGEANAVTEKALKQAEANDKLAKSITPELILYEAVQKWNGIPPQSLYISPESLSVVRTLGAGK